MLLSIRCGGNMMLNYNMGTHFCFESHAIEYKDYFSKLPFYPTSFGCFSCDNQYYTERDRFPECLILYTLEGEGYLKYKDQEIVIPKNCIAVINCYHYQYYANLNTENWDFLWIHFSGKSAADYVDLINDDGLQRIDLSNHLDFQQSFDQLRSLANSTDTYAGLYLSDILNHMLSRLIILSHNSYHQNSRPEHKAGIELAISYIRQNYNQPITIDELAQISRLSKFYFIKVFRQLTGNTPYHFLNLTRINQAKRILLETNLPVHEIASAVGFSDVKNFIYAFKQATQTTPLQFRKFSVSNAEQIL